MIYPYVQSAVDLGRARGPRLALIVHLAEGGGTTGYLSRTDPINPNGVSVHFVIERSGRTVQMLGLDRMHTSIRTSTIRTTDDPDGFYGASAARAVMGAWADTRGSLGPNHASIAVEVEGFAREGPSRGQSLALKALYDDLRKTFPGIRALGHRDFASYKQCPGKLIDWQDLGGHGAAPKPQEEQVIVVTIEKFPSPRGVVAKNVPLRRFSATAELAPILSPNPYSGLVDATVAIESSGIPRDRSPGEQTDRPPAFLRLSSGGSAGKFILAAQVDLT